MIISSNCKINLSLATLYRRDDGFTEIETVMYPLNNSLCDILEMLPSDEFGFSSSGIIVDCPTDKNLCVKAFVLMQKLYNLPPVKIHLHKQIPFGAGLGAGSANAVAVLKLCNSVFELNLASAVLEEIAAQLGSDTAFFVQNRPVVARGRGELLTPIDVDLKGYYILLVKPDIGVSTPEAYKSITPVIPQIMPNEIQNYPLEQWKAVMHNDFEPPIFKKLPLLSQIKNQLYDNGAAYALMSGSGSTVYGLFREKPELKFPYFTHLQQL